jgi:hypothetical protein
MERHQQFAEAPIGIEPRLPAKLTRICGWLIGRNIQWIW